MQQTVETHHAGDVTGTHRDALLRTLPTPRVLPRNVKAHPSATFAQTGTYPTSDSNKAGDLYLASQRHVTQNPA